MIKFWQENEDEDGLPTFLHWGLGPYNWSDSRMCSIMRTGERSEVLDHRLRDRIHTLIRENPSITPTELKKETGAGWGTIVHHLAVMEREGLVASRVEGRHRRFFLADEVAPKDRASLAVLANDRTQEIYTDLLDRPGLAIPEFAQRVGLTPPGVLWHLKRLEENGLVQRRRDGRHVRYYLSGDLGP